VNKKIVFLVFTITPLAHALTFQEHFQKANEFFHSGQHEQAIEQYTCAIALDNNCHQAYFNIGLVYAQQKKYEQAIESYTRAFRLNPLYIKAFLQTGNAYQELKKHEPAIEHYKRGLNIDTNSFECLMGLARALNDTSKFEDSIVHYRAALKLRPNDTQAQFELANTLNLAQHNQESLELYFTMLASMPDNSSLLYNIAYTLKKLNRIEESLPFYEKVLKLDPDNTEAHFSLSLAYLAQGDFERGWPEYEWRWKRDHQGGPRVLSKPVWDGSNLDHKTILLHAEQGLGDTFQFIRYAQEIKKKYSVNIILACQDPLIPLMKLCPYIDTVISLYEKIPHHDVQIPLLSMPYAMKTRLDSIPCHMPYLYADPALVSYWKQKLNPQGLKIGICWQGNSNYSTHFLRTAVAAKSIKLEQCMPLLNIDNVTVYNLQKVTGTDQIEAAKECPRFVTFDQDFDVSHGRFMDTAAVIKNLDLMITVDTSMAHLAAGLGIPTWVLLPEPADWRWMLNRADTPWYPTMRLFRQPVCGDWDSVIHTIVHELKKCMNTQQETELRALEQSIYATQLHINALEREKNFNEDLKNSSAQLHSLLEHRRQLHKK
jgi:tetratricopeptide (TPR) repeat protein